MTRRRVDIVVVAIWVLVLGAAVPLGMATGDGAGAGQLAAVVGIGLTALYRGVRDGRLSDRIWDTLEDWWRDW